MDVRHLLFEMDVRSKHMLETIRELQEERDRKRK